jgi:hypothetical protein
MTEPEAISERMVAIRRAAVIKLLPRHQAERITVKRVGELLVRLGTDGHATSLTHCAPHQLWEVWRYLERIETGEVRILIGSGAAVINDPAVSDHPAAVRWSTWGGGHAPSDPGPDAQPSLFDPTPPAAEPMPARPGGARPLHLTHEQQLDAFLAANPWAVPELVERSRSLKAKGFTHYGIKALIEVLRWQHDERVGNDGSGFTINNNVAPLLARYVMRIAPDLDGFFATRALRAAS